MKIKFFAYFRDYTGNKVIDYIYSGSIKRLLIELSNRYGTKFKRKVLNGDELSDEVIVLVNGRNIEHLDGIETFVGSEDTISIFPVVAGG